MGEHDVKAAASEELRSFVQALLEDLRALEHLIEEGRIESGVRRIGAEQEMFLVDDRWAPCSRSEEILAQLDADFFAPELALFNLETNLSPQILQGECLSLMESELEGLLGRARKAARARGARVILCGILPTLQVTDLTLENMVPNPRFFTLNEVLRELRGGEFRTMIKGLDELQITHDNLMMEACNTSFQVHFQVGPEEFAPLYNLAQVVTAPVLAAAANSPLLLQHRLWHETRVALFQQSLDARSASLRERGSRQRVTFGDRWVESSVLEIFREDVARFRVLLASDLGESSLDVLERGEIPPLNALCLHNGTIYRWNRPCYGVQEGRAHLRIENRVLPAGPTVLDEMANAAFFFGLMVALGEEWGDVTQVMSFDDAKRNFIHAARYGLSAQFHWMEGKRQPARSLILDHLVPLARAGLEEKSVPTQDVDRYMGVIEQRVDRGRGGAQWALDSLAAMGEAGTSEGRHRAVTRATYESQLSGEPVHSWPLASYDLRADLEQGYRRVSQIMTRDVFTVHAEDVVELAASLMDWEHLRRVPVEDSEGRLVGLLTQRSILRLLMQGRADQPVAVREVMHLDPVTVSPDTTSLEAIELMRAHQVGCLPVIQDDKLVGIVTEHDFIQAAAQLLEEALSTDR